MSNKHNSTLDFDAFVKQQQPGANEEEQVFWRNEKDEWLHHLHDLYKHVESFLQEYTDRGEIRISYRDIELNEENIGTYKAPEMIMKIGRQEVTMAPIGTLLVGTKGRVDVIGSAGVGRLALVERSATEPRIEVRYSIGSAPESSLQTAAPKHTDWTWKLVTRPPKVQFIELTRDLFFRMLMEIANA